MTAVILESFDAFEAEPPPAAPQADPGFAAGFEAGHAAAMQEVATREAQSTESAVQAICDLDMTFSEASQAVLEGLTPLFKAIASSLAPQLAAAGLTGQLELALDELAQQQVSHIELRLGGQDHQRLGAALEQSPLGLRIVTDHALEPGVVQISSPQQEQIIDLARAQRAVEQALAALCHETERTAENG